MIYCIAPNDNETISQLLEKLEEKTKENFPNAQITLKNSEIYWKFPECKKLIYNISNDYIISPSEFTDLFNISWEFSSGMVHDINTNKKYYEESFIWNKSCHPSETFLVPQVSWVHIYTWPN